MNFRFVAFRDGAASVWREQDLDEYGYDVAVPSPVRTAPGVPGEDTGATKQ